MNLPLVKRLYMFMQTLWRLMGMLQSCSSAPQGVVQIKDHTLDARHGSTETLSNDLYSPHSLRRRPKEMTKSILTKHSKKLVFLRSLCS